MTLSRIRPIVSTVVLAKMSQVMFPPIHNDVYTTNIDGMISQDLQTPLSTTIIMMLRKRQGVRGVSNLASNH